MTFILKISLKQSQRLFQPTGLSSNNKYKSFADNCLEHALSNLLIDRIYVYFNFNTDHITSVFASLFSRYCVFSAGCDTKG